MSRDLEHSRRRTAALEPAVDRGPRSIDQRAGIAVTCQAHATAALADEKGDSTIVAQRERRGEARLVATRAEPLADARSVAVPVGHCQCRVAEVDVEPDVETVP